MAANLQAVSLISFISLSKGKVKMKTEAGRIFFFFVFFFVVAGSA